MDLNKIMKEAASKMNDTVLLANCLQLIKTQQNLLEQSYSFLKEMDSRNDKTMRISESFHMSNGNEWSGEDLLWNLKQICEDKPI